MIEPNPLPWLNSGQPFPSHHLTWSAGSPAPGLLCAGADLGVGTLTKAYAKGIFPWYSAGQPILWWCPEPRMVLNVENFHISPSFKKSINRFARSPKCEIRIDYAFRDVIEACSGSPRPGQSGTWILPEMVAAYTRLHLAGFAHSVETWIDGQLAGGLYVVGIGHAIFGESMFHRTTDASKIALAALVAICEHSQVPQIDCQQNTKHLTSLGAAEIPRKDFIDRVKILTQLPPIEWKFAPEYWKYLADEHHHRN